MQPLDTDTVTAQDDGSVAVQSTTGGTTLVEDAQIMGIDVPVNVFVKISENGEEQPFETTGDQPKEYPASALPDSISAFVVIFRTVDGSVINPEQVTGKICGEGETITKYQFVVVIVRAVLCA